jgi:hypothetical protein
MGVGRLGEPSLPWDFAGRCRVAGRAEPGGSGGDAKGIEGAALCVADGRVVSELSSAVFGLAGAQWREFGAGWGA